MIRTPEVRSQADKLLMLINGSISDTSLSIELQGHLGKYVCVLASGFLENALADIFSEYVRTRAQPHVARFASNSLRKIQNPKASKFIDVVKGFNEEWADDLNRYLEEDNEKRKNAIDSIMSNRHLIAHGQSSSITLGRVKGFLSSSIEVIEFIETKFN